MPIDRFSRGEFEEALVDILSNKGRELEIIHKGLVSGEYEYHIPLPPNNKVYLAIRSSIDASGFAAKVGANSIRVWLVDARNDQPIGNKAQSWVTRVPGWKIRLGKVMRELTGRRMSTGDCHLCKAPISIFEVKKISPNTGRLFGKCTDCDFWWGWLDKPTNKIYFEKGENENGKVDVTDTSSEAHNELQVPLRDSTKRASDREDSIDGMPEERDSTNDQGSERDAGRIDLSNLPGGNDGGGLGFLSKGPSNLTLVEEEEPTTAGLYLEGDDEKPPRQVSSYDPTPEQQVAILANLDKAIRVLAGPGSGKTFLLVRRYKYLVDSGVDPRNILAVTFTKEMANHLSQEILAMCPAAERGIDQICTIHAICYRMLRAKGDKRSVPKWWKIKKAINDAIDYVWPVDMERPGYKDVLSYVNSAKAKGLEIGADEGFYSHLAGPKLGRLLAKVRKWFDEEMEREGHLTFSDMLLDAEVMLKRDGALRLVLQNRYHYVIIDEGQDTGRQAMRILATLAEPQNQLSIVGDSDQLLYRFAGATPETNLFDGFEKRYYDGDLYKLTVNWRSTRQIVATQLGLIKYNYRELGGPYEARYMKALQPGPDAEEGEPVRFQWFDNPEEEALGVARGIMEDMANGYELADFFIGSRTRAQTAYIEGGLTRANIPYINLCGGTFWTLRHVQDVVGYIKLAYDTSDKIAFSRVFNIASSDMTYPWGERRGQYCPHRYLGRAFLSACDGSYSKALRAAKQRRTFKPGVEDLVRFVYLLQGVIAHDGLDDIVQFILDECYMDHLKAEEGVNSRDGAENGKLMDLATVKDIAGKFGRDVKTFLDYVNEMVKAAERARQRNWSEHVVLSTIHRLKGLERKVVYGVGWCEGHDKSGFPVGLLPHTYSLRPPPQFGILPTRGQGRIEDERCIAFVCISRAKEKVRLSGFEKHLGSTYGPSRFVGEAGIPGGK